MNLFQLRALLGFLLDVLWSWDSKAMMLALLLVACECAGVDCLPVGLLWGRTGVPGCYKARDSVGCEWGRRVTVSPRRALALLCLYQLSSRNHCHPFRCVKHVQINSNRRCLRNSSFFVGRPVVTLYWSTHSARSFRYLKITETGTSAGPRKLWRFHTDFQ